jgi:hypothetical protein
VRTFRQIAWNLADTDRLVDQALRIARADGYAAGVDAERAHTPERSLRKTQSASAPSTRSGVW